MVCISSPQCLICCSWWCVDTEDNKEETSGSRCSPIKEHCDDSTDFLVEPFSFTIAYVDPDIARKRVGENDPQLFSGHWPWDDESILLMVTSIVVTTIVSIVNAAITGLWDPSYKIREIWGCRQEPNVHGGPHACNVTPIIDNNTAARWAKSAMKLSNSMLFCVMYHG